MIEVSMKMPELPKGYEYTGEFRPGTPGDLIVDFRSHKVIIVHWMYENVGITHCAIVKKIPIRQDTGDGYYYVDGVGIKFTFDMRHEKDNLRFEYGNYFIFKDDAIAANKKIMEIFKERK